MIRIRDAVAADQQLTNYDCPLLPYNLSPRSVYLNSEIALIVYSPELARIVADQIEESMRPENS